MPGIDSNTSLMLHMDGTDGSTTFTDSSLAPVTCTANGDAQIDTADYKFATGSGLFDGTGDYVTFPDSSSFQMGSGSWTIDFWMNPTNNTGNKFVLADFDGSGSLYSIAIQHTGASIIFNVTFTDSSQANITHQTAIQAGVWQHIAMVRSGTALNGYVDGVKDNSAYDAGTKTVKSLQAAANWTLGRSGDYAGNYYPGALDEFRWSKGAARWTTNFTPPTAAYTVDQSGGFLKPKTFYWGD